MEYLNYHHLYYFWVIAREGSVTKACAKLRLAQSTLSAQLKSLEETLGQKLFDRKNRSLELTESGRLVLNYADTIFSTGRELLDVLRNRPTAKRQVAVRVGCMNSISKAVQLEFVSPLLSNADVRLTMTEASLPTLTRQLQNHMLDVLVTNMAVPTDRLRGLFNHALGEVDVWIVGQPKYSKLRKGAPASLNGMPLFIPTHQSRVRSDFDRYLEETGAVPQVRGEIDDVALLRLFALSGAGLAVLPEITVREDIAEGKLIAITKMPTVYETVWAITGTRRIPNPFVQEMIRKFSGKYRVRNA